MSEKIYLDAQQLLEDSFRLADQVIASGFRPTRMVALWRGGVPIGVAVQELLRQAGIALDHFAIRTSLYTGIEQRDSAVALFGLEELAARCLAQDRLLLVDDVWDTGLTIQTLIGELQRLAGSRTPAQIRVAVPYFKPRFNKTGRTPDYHLYQTDAWLMYPHALEGLNAVEIAQHRPELAAIIALAKPSRTPG